jgi:hypothetical protein
MSEAADLYRQAHDRGLIMPGDREALDHLRRAAEVWRRQDNHLAAGFAMTAAIHGAWGDGELVDSCAAAALSDFDRCIATRPRDSLESLLALYKSYIELTRYAPVGEYRWPELGNRLLSLGDRPGADGFLVRGFLVEGDLAGEWTASVPQEEVLPGSMWWGGSRVRVSFPSALHVLVRIPDYQGAMETIRRCPDAFTTPGLRGWRAAVQGFIRPAEAPERFAEAAAAFSEDKFEPGRRSSWSSANVDLWAKYFRARVALARVPREPGRVAELLREATSALTGTESGWVNGHVSRLRILAQSLSQLFGDGPGLTPHKARDQFVRELQWTGRHDDDEVSLRFFNLVSESFEGFRNNPAEEMTTGRLRDAIEALGRVSLLGPGVSAAVSPALGRRAFREALGPDRTWVHRALEGIKDEAVFRRLLMRLLQASPTPPAYGHVRHGPLEHGKDVVVVLDEGGRRTLRMYQAKCGDITTRVWREAKDELDEVFDVPLPEFQVRGEVHEREGILICNGHANPHAEPAMLGWFERQARDHGRAYRFMHLDDVAGWIDQQRLYGTFRGACAELGLSTSPAAPGQQAVTKAKTKKAATKRSKPGTK